MPDPREPGILGGVDDFVAATSPLVPQRSTEPKEDTRINLKRKYFKTGLSASPEKSALGTGGRIFRINSLAANFGDL
jgi:hypothetical protein